MMSTIRMTTANSATFARLVPLITVALLMLSSVAGCNSPTAVGSIAFSPSSYSCSANLPTVVTADLPSSVNANDVFTNKLDGVEINAFAVLTYFTKQSDGSWQYVYPGTTGCTMGNQVLSVGSHTFQIVDSNGKVMAQGTFTITP